MGETTAELLAELDQDARDCKPRLFALYGVRYRDQEAFLAWGMQFNHSDQTLMWGETGTWRSESAEKLLKTHAMLGESRLVWLDEPPAPPEPTAGRPTETTRE
jgi:hypothetical protein